MRMNRNIIIAGVVVLVLILALAGFMTLSKGKQPSTNSAQNAEPQNVISSIQDMIAKGASLECNYTTSEGVKIASYIKNGMVRSDMTGKDTEQNGSTIVNTKDKKVYYWNGKTGYVMVIPDLSVTPAAGQGGIGNTRSNLAELEQYKNYCKSQNVSDSHFVLPADVKFQDMSAMMPSKPVAPSGSQAAPSGMNQQQIQEMMKRYTTPTQ